MTKDFQMGQINSQSQTIFIPLVLGVAFQILYFKSKNFIILPFLFSSGLCSEFGRLF